MRTTSLLLLLIAIGAFPLPAAEVDFAHEIVPLLKKQCSNCHASTQKKGGFSFNDRESLLAGGESGAAVVSGKSDESDLLSRIASQDKSYRMPPEGARLPDKQAALLKRWIDGGVAWEPGFTFGTRAYDPPLALQKVELPPSVHGRNHAIDRLLDAYCKTNSLPIPAPISDAAFARRAYLDLIGLLPAPEELEKFLADRDPRKRARLIHDLLQRDGDYAEHWLTFWNDLLRNDYSGTGFITGGRKQISKWLYAALAANMPYDRMARELIAPPSDESAGFADGIRWRGEVSAGQTVEIQFAQSTTQAFLGINMKCASCHDSFVDKWTLDDAYGLAAIYSDRPLELHRCDKPIGKQAQAAWIFPSQGKIDPQAPKRQRLKQMADLMTAAENGRFSRTIVNRLWQRLMGHGIVHPIDAMQMEPWNAGLLDYLAAQLIENKYDLKKILELIATSEAYQSQAETVAAAADGGKYTYRGPRAKRLTAEQFVDSIWQITGAAPAGFDAPVTRVRRSTPAMQAAPKKLTGRWIWSQANASAIPAGETLVFRGDWTLEAAPSDAVAAVACDNSYKLYLNGKLVQVGDNWELPDRISLTSALKPGKNAFLIVAKNGGVEPNPAGLYFEARALQADGAWDTFATGDAWQWSPTLPTPSGAFKVEPVDWKAAKNCDNPQLWMARVGNQMQDKLQPGGAAAGQMVRASLLKSDFLMRSLGRPNRDQIVSMRPAELSTLEAIDLSNGETLAAALRTGAGNILQRKFDSVDGFTAWLYRFALDREPTGDELRAVRETMPQGLTQAGVEDSLWSVVMLPEFMLVR